MMDKYVPLPTDFEIQQLACSLLEMYTAAVHQVMSFWARPIFVPVDMHNFPVLSCVSEWHVDYCCPFVLINHSQLQRLSALQQCLVSL